MAYGKGQAATGPTDKALRGIYDRIRSGDPSPMYLIHGEDEYRRGQFARNLVRWIVPEAQRDLSLVTIEGDASVPRILGELESQSLGFFDADLRVVWLRQTPLCGARPPGGKEAIEPLARRLEAGLPVGTILVLEAAGAVDTKNRIAELASKLGTVVAFPEIKGVAAAQAFVVDRLKKAGVTADRRAVDYLLAVCPEDPRQLANEVTKLVTYVGAGGRVTEDAVREIVSVSRMAVVFDVADAIADRQVEQALRLTRELLGRGESAVWLAMLLANRFRMLRQARLLVDRIPAVAALARNARYSGQFRAELDRAVPREIAEQFPDDKQASLLKQHPFVIHKSLLSATRFTTEELETALEQLLTLDFALKTTTGLEDAALLELVIADLCSGGKAGAQRVLLRSIR